jgi:hypothetical protein
MRGFVNNSTDGDFALVPNSNTDEASWNGPTGAVMAAPTATGFTLEANGANFNTNGVTYIYIAIRRGPMKTPTDATKVFAPVTTSASTGTAITTNFPVDLQMLKYRTGAQATMVLDRLRGISSSTTEAGVFLQTSNANAEVADNTVSRYWNNTGYQVASGWTLTDQVNWNFGRAPSFFDEVCYTGTGSATTVAHNLAAVPELMIVRNRAGDNWAVYSTTGGGSKYMLLDATWGFITNSSYWDSTNPTASVFSVGTTGATNESAKNYVAYLFATCAGVSKVGSYTGTGTTQQINCGFTGGARFVMIKRTDYGGLDSANSWYIWDSARGIVAGNDPYLLLNSTAAEVTNTDYVDTYSAGFEISSTAPSGINASGGTYIFLAIA